MNNSPEVEIIYVSENEYIKARNKALKEIGLTYEELRKQAKLRDFSSLRAQKLWLSIKE